MAVIAMTREMGSLGKDVALVVAERLGLEIVHNELVENDLAHRMHPGESEVHRFLEGEERLRERWKIGKGRLSYFTREEILELADRSNVLIRGWGSTRLLRSIPHVLSVRVCAPMKLRVEEMMRRLGISKERAKREIDKSDAGHERTMLRIFKSDWREPLNYDLVVNTEHVPVEFGAELIVQASQAPAFAETEASKAILQDKLLEARIRSSVVENGLASDAKHIYASVSSGFVRLYGSAHRSDTALSVERLVQSIHGVRGIENEIVNIHNFTRS